MDDSTAGDPKPDDEGPPDGLVTVRGAILGVALLWLAAMSGFGAVQATVYSRLNGSIYLLLAVGAASLSLTAGYASLRAFGVK